MVDIKTNPKSLRSLVNEIKKGKYNFDLSIQRREGIWSTKEKSLFIDTLLRDYPIYPALVNKHSDTNVIDVVDFKQRFTAIASYVNDEFRLSRDLEPLFIEGVEYEISGKKFSKLDESVQDKLFNRDISIITMTDATQEEISDIFERINMGHQLSNGQKRSVLESEEVRNIIYSLADHPLFEKLLSKAQFKKNLDRDLVIQCLMLTEKNDNNNFTSFVNAGMNNFILYYNDKIDDPNERPYAERKIENIRKALDKLNEELPDGTKIKTATIPMCIYGMYRMYRDSKSTSKYMDWLNQFLESYSDNEDYLQYCNNGTNSATKVNGRLQYFKNAINELN